LTPSNRGFFGAFARLGTCFAVLYVPINGVTLKWCRLHPIKLSKGFSFAGRDKVVAKLLISNQLVNKRLRIIDVGSGEPYEDNNTELFQTDGNAEITSIMS
jgi:hypothetical protein